MLDPGASPSVFTAARDLLPERQPRAVLVAGPDDRRPHQAGHRRPGRRDLGVYGPFSDVRELAASPAPPPPRRTRRAPPRSSSRSTRASRAAQLRSFLESRAGELGTVGKDNLFGAGKLLLGAAPGEPPARTATTGAASGVTTAAATVAGSVNPRGSPTTYHFEFGPTTAYGRRTAELPVALPTGARP